jgi:DNA-binding beta-propeller fold protein YncE
MSRRAALGSISLLGCLFVQTSYAQKIYWHHWENGTGKIKRANLDGTNPEDTIDLGTEGVADIAIDRPGGKIYWTAQSTIRRANLDGSVIETFLPAQQPGALAIDEVNRWIYWGSDLKFGAAGINRATLEGQFVEEIISTGDASVYGLAVDPRGGKIYYSFIFPAVFWANLDGSQPEILITNASQNWTAGVALDLLNDKVYWTDFNGSTLRRANLDGTAIEILPIPVTNPHEITVDPCNGMLYWNEFGGTARRARVDGQQTENIISSGVNNIVINDLLDDAGTSPKCIPTLTSLGVVFMMSAIAAAACVILHRRDQSCSALYFQLGRVAKVGPFNLGP